MTHAFDPTGKALQNKIIGETKTILLAPGASYLFTIPLEGPYFAESLVIKYTPTTGTPRILSEGIDYHPSFQYVEATRKLNAPVYAAISFIDTTLDGTVTYNYQSLGSDYAIDSTVITNIESTNTFDPIFTAWESIVTLPTIPTITHPWSVVNVDDVSHAVEELAKVGLVAHLRPKFLPEPGESVFIPTPEEIGLGNVPNYPVATTQEAIDGTENEALMTPVTTKAAVGAEVTKQLSDIGYLVTVPYAGSINITSPRASVEYQGETYNIKDTSVPYVTTGNWNTDSIHFELKQFAAVEKWTPTDITVVGTEPTISGLGTVFTVDVEHDSRIAPQLILNDLIYLVYTVDYKLDTTTLYVNYPLEAGDTLKLLTKRSLLSMRRDPVVNKVFTVVDNINTFDVSDVSVDEDNLRVVVNDFIYLNKEIGDYSINGGVLTVNYRLGTGDIVEVENVESSTIFGKTALRNLLLD